MMNKHIRFALAALALTVASVVNAATFNLFQPANGILVGNPSTYVTTAATSSNVIALWTGTCNSSTFLRGDGSCAAALSGTVPVANGGTGATSLSGVLKGNGTSPVTSAANSDVISLWTGTCNASSFLRGDGSCQAAGGTPAGANTQLQYNASGAFGADDDLTFSAGSRQLFVGVTNSGIIQSGDNASGGGRSLTVRAGGSTGGSGSGGSLSLTGGFGDAGQSGGNVTLQAGDSGASGSTTFGGSTLINGGRGQTGTNHAGGVYITGGQVLGDGNGGEVIVAGSNGVGTNRNGGQVAIQGGSPTGSGTAGIVSFWTVGVERLRFDGAGAWGLAGANYGTNGQVLTSAGPGAAPTWTTVSASPGGSSTQVQYNNGGVFGGDAGMTYNAGTDTLSIGTVTAATAVTVGGQNVCQANGTNCPSPGGTSLPVRSISTTDNTQSTDCGKVILFTGAGSQTFTLDADPAVNCVLTFINNGSASTSLAASGTLTWFNGSGTNNTGTRTIAVGGVVTATVLSSAGSWQIWGAGISL